MGRPQYKVEGVRKRLLCFGVFYFERRNLVKVFVETGINRRGLWLSQEELKMLAVLADMRMMSSKQLYQFLYPKKHYTYNGFLNRLKKYEKCKIILSYDLTIGQAGFRYRYHRISQRGIDLLKEHDYLPNNWEPKPFRKYVSRKWLDHALATREATTILLSKLWEHHRLFQIEDTLLNEGETYLGEGEERLIPDFIIKLEDRNVYIELDTGSEHFPTIVNKVRKYDKFSIKTKKKRHTLYFVILDASFQSIIQYAGDRQRRIANMKQAILQEWSPHNSNLDIVVLSLTRLYKQGYQFIKDNYASEKDIYRRQIDFLSQLLNMKHTDGRFLQSQHLPSPLSEKFSLADLCFERTKELEKKERWWVVQMREGDMNSLGRALELHEWIQRYGVQELDYVVLVYQRKEEMENDVVGGTYPQLLSASIEEWLQNIALEEPLMLYESTSPFKWEEKEYEI